MKTLETKRLILRPFELTDLDDFFEYCSLETVGPNAGWSVHTNKDFSLKIIQGFIAKGDVLALVFKDNNKVIGSIGLHFRENNLKEKEYELGYVLSTHYEGRGLMTEATKRVIKYAFLEENIPKIMACHFVENEKSRRVIEKNGFKYEKTDLYKTLNFGTKESRYYYLTKEEYIKNMEGTK